MASPEEDNNLINEHQELPVAEEGPVPIISRSSVNSVTSCEIIGFSSTYRWERANDAAVLLNGPAPVDAGTDDSALLPERSIRSSTASAASTRDALNLIPNSPSLIREAVNTESHFQEEVRVAASFLQLSAPRRGMIRAHSDSELYLPERIGDAAGSSVLAGAAGADECSDLSYDELKAKVAHLERALTCPVCLLRRREVVFVCGHAVCCSCSLFMERCGLCRKAINKRIRLY